jgi:hypothetical protein
LLYEIGFIAELSLLSPGAFEQVAFVARQRVHTLLHNFVHRLVCLDKSSASNFVSGSSITSVFSLV